jgi:hypothetical protein
VQKRVAWVQIYGWLADRRHTSAFLSQGPTRIARMG